MDEVIRQAASGPTGWDLRLSVRRLVAAVIVGEAIWSLLVSIINNLAVPALARVMGGDPQSPLYLGKGDINIPALLISMLQACLAGIVAVIVNAWPQKARQVRPSTVRVPKTPRSSAPPSITAPSVATPVRTEAPAIQGDPPVAEMPPTPQPATSAKQSEPPAKPKKPKQVYYNIVGDPIEDDEE